MTAQVYIRADASITQGQGHVMRCLSLANLLRDQGSHCTFLCQERQGHLMEMLRRQGFSVHPLPVTEDWQDDAQSTLTIIAQNENRPIDWLVVDHYGLDARWESAVRANVRHLMVIDDLASRDHDCELLLDQNAGRKTNDYQNLVPPHCKLIIGPAYAMLRDEFRRQRALGPQRSCNGRLEHLLISLGGTDAKNVTGELMTVLAEQLSDALGNLKQITVVLGVANPWKDDVRNSAALLPWPVRVVIDAQNMAELLASADLAIGAGGISAWERCCLGLPSLVIATADNQVPGSLALHSLGAAQFLGEGSNFAPALRRVLSEELSSEALRTMAEHAANLVDGHGTLRVLQAMNDIAKTIPDHQGARLRVMTERDLSTVLGWRNHPQVREFMRHRHTISEAEHKNWFARKRDQGELPYLFELNGRAMGFVQFEPAGCEGTAEWGFYLAPNAPRGSGHILGKVAVRHAFERKQLTKIVGHVMSGNLPSIRFHERLGFRHDNLAADETLLRFSLSRSDWRPTSESGEVYAA